MSVTSQLGYTTVLGTVSGTALAISVNIGSPDIARTVILAVIGAVVSFGVSVLLKTIFVKRR